jgi:hypothetical protein
MDTTVSSLAFVFDFSSHEIIGGSIKVKTGLEIVVQGFFITYLLQNQKSPIIQLPQILVFNHILQTVNLLEEAVSSPSIALSLRDGQIDEPVLLRIASTLVQVALFVLRTTQIQPLR